MSHTPMRSQTLHWYMDDTERCILKAQLRGRVQEMSSQHSLHNLWDAYMRLEADYLHLVQKLERVRLAVTDA
jgi:hypothetical protein